MRRPDEWQPDDDLVVKLARDIVTARQGADRVQMRRQRRVAESARIAAWAAEQRAIASPTAENVTHAFAKKLVVAALDLADDPVLYAKVAI